MATKKTTSSTKTSNSTKSTSASKAKRSAKSTAAATPQLTPLPPRKEKPFFSVTTWVTLLVLVLVVVFAYFFNQQKTRQAATATPTAGTTMLFDSMEGQPTDIKIESSTGPSVEVARNDKGVWVLKAPTQADADQASVEAAATQIGALNIVSDVPLAPDVVGLDKPSYTITLTFSGGKTHKVTVGSVNPIQTGYYCQLDGGKIQIVDKQGLDALLSMVTKPPYVATATPAETATLESTSTPTAAPVTDTPSTPSTPSGTQATPSVTATP